MQHGVLWNKFYICTLTNVTGSREDLFFFLNERVQISIIVLVRDMKTADISCLFSCLD